MISQNLSMIKHMENNIFNYFTDIKKIRSCSESLGESYISYGQKRPLRNDFGDIK